MMSLDTEDQCINGDFGNDAIQLVFDRFELFKNSKAFDPTNPKLPVSQYQFNEKNGIYTLAIDIDANYMSEYFKKTIDNDIETVKGHYRVKDHSVILNYERSPNGFKFHDWANGRQFESSIQKIDDEIPINFEEDYKIILVGLHNMRRKMFDFQRSLSKEDLELVELYDVHPLTNGIHAQYNENNGKCITVSSGKKDGKSVFLGKIKIRSDREQRFIVVDGRVVIHGGPYQPFYH